MRLLIWLLIAMFIGLLIVPVSFIHCHPEALTYVLLFIIMAVIIGFIIQDDNIKGGR